MTVNPIFASNFTANVKILFYVRKEWVFQISKRQLWALHLACLQCRYEHDGNDVRNAIIWLKHWTRIYGVPTFSIFHLFFVITFACIFYTGYCSSLLQCKLPIQYMIVLYIHNLCV